MNCSDVVCCLSVLLHASVGGYWYAGGVAPRSSSLIPVRCCSCQVVHFPSLFLCSSRCKQMAVGACSCVAPTIEMSQYIRYKGKYLPRMFYLSH